MNWPKCSWDQARLAAWAIGVAGTFCLLAGLVWVMQNAPPPAIDQARAELRRKNIVELRAADKAALESYGVVDQTKGIYRLPVERAMELSLVLWKEPAAARSNLLARVDKAAAKPPEKPNVYE